MGLVRGESAGWKEGVVGNWGDLEALVAATEPNGLPMPTLLGKCCEGCPCEDCIGCRCCWCK